MNSTVNIHLRVPLEQARILKRAARREGKKLATFVRDAAVKVAAEIHDEQVNATIETIAKALT